MCKVLITISFINIIISLACLQILKEIHHLLKNELSTLYPIPFLKLWINSTLYLNEHFFYQHFNNFKPFQHKIPIIVFGDHSQVTKIAQWINIFLQVTRIPSWLRQVWFILILTNTDIKVRKSKQAANYILHSISCYFLSPCCSEQ